MSSEEYDDDIDDEDDDYNRADDADDDDGDFDDDGDANSLLGVTAVDVLEYITRSIVDEPDEIEIEVDDGHDPVRLNVHAASGDMGRLIGRRGRVAGAIRTVVRAAASRDELLVDIEFVE